MNKDSRIYIAGHRGLVGSAIERELTRQGYAKLITSTRQELDLTNQAQVVEFFKVNKPEYVYLAAAKVGGIHANDTYPAEFIRDNLLMQTNIIDSAYQNGAKKLLFLGSSCIYPKLCNQPMREEYLLTGSLEPTNEWYAIAKIAGIKMCQAYRKQYDFNSISLMPTNLYGPGDNFHLENSHVLPALIRKFHEAKLSNSERVQVWGTGTPRREFLHVDDLAAASVHLMNYYNDPQIVNVGVGQDISIAEVAQLVREIVGFKGEICYDSSKPDGTPRKLLDVNKLKQTGWEPKIGMKQGLESTYEWFLAHEDDYRT